MSIMSLKTIKENIISLLVFISNGNETLAISVEVLSEILNIYASLNV